MATTDVAAVDRAHEARLRDGARALAVVIPPALLAILYFKISLQGHAFAYDFEHSFWPAGRDVLHSQSPFPHVTPGALRTGTAFVYPPFAALVMAPFALLSIHASAALFTALLVISAPLALYLCGVRDWRCYAAIFLWRPVLSALQTANLSLPLALGTAALWRYRDRRTVAVLLTGAIVALKLFLWPLVVWLIATRRLASGLVAIAVAAGLTAFSWAVIGFAGVSSYVPLLRLLARLEERASFTPLVIGLKLGLGFDVAHVLGLCLATAVLGVMVTTAWRTQDEKRSFVLALVASILFSPVVWLHYYALFIVAIAVLRPRYGVAWVLPLVVILAPPRPLGPSWWVAVVLATFALMLAVALRREEHAPMPV